jgi:hypothetical protein
MHELLTDEQAYALMEVLERMSPADLMPFSQGDWNKGMAAWEALGAIYAEISVLEGLEPSLGNTAKSSPPLRG